MEYDVEYNVELEWTLIKCQWIMELKIFKSFTVQFIIK